MSSRTVVEGSAEVHCILNPTAGGGRAARLAPWLAGAVEDRLGRGSAFCVTSKPGEATMSARSAIRAGASLILVAGGDGTIQEVVNGYFEDGRPLNPDCELAVVSCGTGHGFADSVRLAGTLEAQLDAALSGEVWLLDVGRIRYRRPDGAPAERLFVNECQLGIGGAVCRSVDRAHKLLGGTLAFGLAAIRHLIRHRAAPLRLCLDDDLALTGRYLGVVVGNGALTGGGMRLAPAAMPDDGHLDVVTLGDMSVAERLLAFPRIYRGLHTTLPQVRVLRCRRLVVDGPPHVPLAADGEVLGDGPCEIDMLPAALPVRGTGLPFLRSDVRSG